MERTPLVHVVILYAHPLLGEGLAKVLSADDGVSAVAVAKDDAMAAAVALAARPDVVVVERIGRPDTAPFADHASAPLVLFVGLEGTDDARQDETMTRDPEGIIRAIRSLKRTKRAPLVRV